MARSRRPARVDVSILSISRRASSTSCRASPTVNPGGKPRTTHPPAHCPRTSFEHIQLPRSTHIKQRRLSSAGGPSLRRKHGYAQRADLLGTSAARGTGMRRADDEALSIKPTAESSLANELGACAQCCRESLCRARRRRLHLLPPTALAGKAFVRLRPGVPRRAAGCPVHPKTASHPFFSSSRTTPEMRDKDRSAPPSNPIGGGCVRPRREARASRRHRIENLEGRRVDGKPQSEIDIITYRYASLGPTLMLPIDPSTAARRG